MLEVIIPGRDDLFDNKTETFYKISETKLQLEHSLLSIRKWEAKWHCPFLSTNLNPVQSIDYIRCMALNDKNVDPVTYLFIPQDVINTISDYINDPMTATTFSDAKEKMMGAKRRNEVITAEIIYYWMISLNIPWEFERWHLKQLFTLIKTVSIKNEEADPMKKKKRKGSKEAAMERNRINMERRAKYGSKG